MRTLIILLSLSLSLPAPAETVKKQATTVIEVWTRAPGDHSAGGVQKLHRARVDVRSLKPTEKKLFDLQYQKKLGMKVVPLRAVLDKADTRRGDTLLLHFENGMIIPLPNDPAVLDKVDAHIAIDVRAPDASWRKELPYAIRHDDVTVDPAPIVFGQNKVVVEKGFLPGLIAESGEYFTPWRHCDSLTGIEVVDGNAYRSQYEVLGQASAAAKHGAKVFVSACMYCHSVRDVGATYGWDFMLPYPLHEHKKPRALYEHVTVEKALAADKGLMMPTQHNIQKRDVAGLQAWSKEVHQAGASPNYQPKR